MTYYLYHIPGKKIGVTRDLKNRVEEQQGYDSSEYRILMKSDNIDYISEQEIYYQKKFGYRIDEIPYNKLKCNKMNINITEQTTTFPCPVNKLKGQLMDNIGMSWETDHGECKITHESIKWIMKNVKESMYNEKRSYIYNKAFSRWFDNNDADPKTQTLKLMEEAGEICRAVLKKDESEIIDGIGDCVVVLTNLAHLCDTSIEECIEAAYDEIKNRTGKMDNGTFKKD
jgi:NTP pyrophosphatase (non-canonical NTP hydrolase)